MRTPVPGQPLVNVSGALGDWDGALVLTLEGRPTFESDQNAWTHWARFVERLGRTASQILAGGRLTGAQPRWWVQDCTSMATTSKALLTRTPCVP